MKTTYIVVGLIVSGFLLGFVTALFWTPTVFPNIFGAAQQANVREYTIVIEPADIELAPGVIWHAWTYNGTIPGPTLYAKVGDLIRVRAINRLNLTHSLHPHLPYYDLQHDGSQINIITGVGKGSMIPPGGEWVYEWPATKAGIWYYHCHSADGGLRIVDHMLRGPHAAAIAAAALAFFAVITIPLFSRIDARPSSTAGNISVFLHASSVDEWSG